MVNVFSRRNKKPRRPEWLIHGWRGKKLVFKSVIANG